MRRLFESFFTDGAHKETKERLKRASVEHLKIGYFDKELNLMDFRELDRVKEYMEIPSVFYSDENSKPFSHCISCDKYLLKNGTLYFIEKAVKKYEKFKTTDTIFEYAMCLDCYLKVWETFSVMSKTKIQDYFDRNVNLDTRKKTLLEKNVLKIDDWLSRCIIKGTSVREVSQYQICCQCDGKNMLFGYSPFMISGEAVDEIANLLSNKTLGEIDGFVGEFFGWPPELEKSPRDQPVFVM